MTRDEISLTDLQKETLKALTQDYASVRQETTAHVQLYKTQERYGTALVAVAGLFIPLLFGVSISAQGVADMQKLVTPGTVLLASFVISTVLFHMYFSTLANLFALQVLAERCVLLEEEINKHLSGQYLIWERLTTLIWSKDGFPIHKMPDKVVGLFSTLLILVLAIALPLFTVLKTLVEHHDPAFTFAVAIYIWYLFVAMTIGFTNFVAMANVRDECHRLFREAINDGRIFREAVENTRPSAGWSDAKALLTIFSITAAVVLVGIFVVLRIFAGCLPLRCFMAS